MPLMVTILGKIARDERKSRFLAKDLTKKRHYMI